MEAVQLENLGLGCESHPVRVPIQERVETSRLKYLLRFPTSVHN